MSGRLRYWHPVLESARLPASRAVAVKIAGNSIALFRGSDAGPAAIEDKCAHRRMKLSLGQVQGGRLVCPYHGWSFQPDGAGESPSAPKMYACLTSFDCAEAHGVIWVKARGSDQPLPHLSDNGGAFVGAVFNKVQAPLELVIDNFSEVEHTVAMHPHFGFDPARAREAVAELESTDQTVTMRNRGPAKMPPLDTRVAAGIRRDDFFHSDYTFRFDPPRSSVTHLWIDAKNGRERRIRYHIFHYFVPEDASTTSIVSFGFLSLNWPLVRRFSRQLGVLFRRRIRQTVDEDAFLLENLADKSVGLEGMKLSRFDPILGLTRERLRRIYDGNSA
jgi:phenylpropionate dioxygenase-like ring-hydroxylating dioxygenase large terminal subunit